MFEPEAIVLLKSVRDTFKIVSSRKENNSNPNNFTLLLLEKFDTFQKEIQAQIKYIHNRINSNSDSTTTKKPCNEKPSNFNDDEPLIIFITIKLGTTIK